MKHGLASIVILTWNTPEEAIKCIGSLRKQTYKNFEIILVDNGSSKENVAKLKGYLKNRGWKRLRPIFNKKNLGFCEGNNVGVRASRGEYVVFLSDDTIPDKNWLKYLVEPFGLGEGIGGTASKVIFSRNNTIQYAGGRLKFYGKAESEGLTQKDSKIFNHQKQTLWGQGCSIAFRRKVLNRLGEYFCPQFFIYFDDLDLCWRVNGIGYRIIYNPKSFLLHKGSVSVEKNAAPGSFVRRDQLYRNLRNKYLAFWRNLRVWQLPLIMPFVFGYDAMKSLYLVARGDTVFYGSRFNYLATSLSAFFGFLQLAGEVKKPRKASLSDLSW